MEEARRTVIHITTKGQWIHTTSNKKHKSDSTSSSCSDSESYSDSSCSDSDSSIEEDFIRIKSSSHSKKKHVGIGQKDKNINTGHPATSTSNSKQESSGIVSLIKQFGAMKILLAEAVTKVDRLKQSKNSCKNYRSSTYTTSNCH